MSVLKFLTDLPGQINDKPRRPKLMCSDSLATITTAGYLNNVVKLTGQPVYPTDIIDCWYGLTSVDTVGSGIYTPLTVTVSNGVITLAEVVSPGNVLLPVVSGDVAVYNGTTGQISDSGVLGTNIVSKAAVNTMAAGSSIVLAKVSGTEAANAVTASGTAGIITTSSLTTAGGSSYAITWTNTFISTTSVIQLTIMGGTNTTENVTLKATAGAGTSTLTIYNNTASTALNGTILIGYTVL